MHPVIQTIINQLKSYQPEGIILFGSYAYGQPSEDSDVDLLVIKRTNKTFRERNIEARLLLKTKVPVDVFVLTPQEFKEYKTSIPFVEEIAKHGRVIYG